MKLTLNELTYLYKAAKDTREMCIRWGTMENEEGKEEFKLDNLSNEDKRKYEAVCSIIEKLEKVEF